MHLLKYPPNNQRSECLPTPTKTPPCQSNQYQPDQNCLPCSTHKKNCQQDFNCQSLKLTKTNLNQFPKKARARSLQLINSNQHQCYC